MVEIFSDGPRCPNICYSNVIPVQRFKVEIFSDGYTNPKFIPYEILSHENQVNEKKDNYSTYLILLQYIICRLAAGTIG